MALPTNFLSLPVETGLEILQQLSPTDILRVFGSSPQVYLKYRVFIPELIQATDNYSELNDTDLLSLQKRTRKIERDIKKEVDHRKAQNRVIPPSDPTDNLAISLSKTYELYQRWSSDPYLPPKYDVLGFRNWSFDEFRAYMMPYLTEIDFSKAFGEKVGRRNREVSFDFLRYIEDSVPERTRAWRERTD